MIKSICTFLTIIMIAGNMICYNATAQSRPSGNPDKNIGIGVRLGDPMGLSIKKYLGNNALELNFGRSYMFSGKRFYNDRYDHWYKDWHKTNFYYRDMNYIGYSRSFPVSIQLHYLVHKEIKQLEGLQWYFGGGAQFRSQKYTYNYRYKLEGNPNWFSGSETTTDIDFGLDGVIGLEYQVPDLPFSVFTDMNLFFELVDHPFVWGQGGIGIRYNF